MIFLIVFVKRMVWDFECFIFDTNKIDFVHRPTETDEGFVFGQFGCKSLTFYFHFHFSLLI